MPNPSITAPGVFTLPGQGQSLAPLTVQNTGSVSLYFSKDPQVSASSYDHVVGPGGSIVWPALTNCYVVPDVGQTGQISYGTPGTTVDTGSVISQSSNTPTLLTSLTLHYGGFAGENVTAALPKSLDISAWSSVYFSLHTDIKVGTIVNGSNFIPLSVFQSRNGYNFFNGGNLQHQRFAQWLLSVTDVTGIIQSLQVPVRAPLLDLSLQVINNAAFVPGAGNLTLEIYGSNEVITESRYINLGSAGNNMEGTAGSGGLFVAQLLSNGSVQHFVSSSSDVAYITALNSGAAGTGARVDIFTYDYGVLRSFSGVGAPAVIGAANEIALKLPSQPIVLGLVTGGGALLTGSMTQ